MVDVQAGGIHGTKNIFDFHGDAFHERSRQASLIMGKGQAQEGSAGIGIPARRGGAGQIGQEDETFRAGRRLGHQVVQEEIDVFLGFMGIGLFELGNFIPERNHNT